MLGMRLTAGTNNRVMQSGKRDCKRLMNLERQGTKPGANKKDRDAMARLLRSGRLANQLVTASSRFSEPVFSPLAWRALHAGFRFLRRLRLRLLGRGGFGWGVFLRWRFGGDLCRLGSSLGAAGLAMGFAGGSRRVFSAQLSSVALCWNGFCRSGSRSGLGRSRLGARCRLGGGGPAFGPFFPASFFAERCFLFPVQLLPLPRLPTRLRPIGQGAFGQNRQVEFLVVAADLQIVVRQGLFGFLVFIEGLLLDPCPGPLARASA